jgi:hypothetical protein
MDVLSKLLPKTRLRLHNRREIAGQLLSLRGMQSNLTTAKLLSVESINTPLAMVYAIFGHSFIVSRETRD